MFPLSTVVFPGCTVALHVFEPRYLKLIADLQRGQSRLGSVLISHGHEVGGGDRRFTVGAICRLEEIAITDQGTYFMVLAGEERLEVTAWLPDDPYPVALVHQLSEVDMSEATSTALAKVERLLRQVLAAGAEAGQAVSDATFELSLLDPRAAMYRMCDLAPIPILDKQRLLEAQDVETVLGTLTTCLTEAYEAFIGLMAG